MHAQPTSGLQLADQPFAVIGLGGQGQWIRTGTSLPDPEMAPAFGQLLFGTPLARYRLGADKLSQLRLGFISLPSVAPAILERAVASAAGKAFAQGPAAAAGLEHQLHFGVWGGRAAAHLLQDLPTGLCREEQGPVESFHQRALTGFVGAADPCEGRRLEVHMQVVVAAVVAQAGGNQAHRSTSRAAEAMELP